MMDYVYFIIMVNLDHFNSSLLEIVCKLVGSKTIIICLFDYSLSYRSLMDVSGKIIIDNIDILIIYA